MKELGIPEFGWPTSPYKITTAITTRYDPDGSIHGEREHEGIDIASKDPAIPTDTMPILAAASAKILSITQLGKPPKKQKYTDWWDWTSQVKPKEVWSDQGKKNLKAKQIEYGLSGRMLRSGITIVIEHGDGWETKYLHVKNDEHYQKLLRTYKANRAKGQDTWVKKGETIATVGNTLTF